MSTMEALAPIETVSLAARREQAKAAKKEMQEGGGLPTHIHRRKGDARSLDWIPSESVHLAVTSPPYWTLKDYNGTPRSAWARRGLRRDFSMNSTACGDTLFGFWFQAVGSCVLSAMSAWHARTTAGT